MTWQRILVDGRLQLRFVPQLEFALPQFAFDQQRGTCEACAHIVIRTTRQNERELLCGAEGRSAAHRGCSFLRHPGQPCGPDAALFTPSTQRSSS